VRLWHLVKLFAGGGMLVVLGAAALMLWPLLWPPDPDVSVQLVNGRLLGEATGYVGRIDRDARTVDVSASLVGWRPVVLTVNEATAILVQNRQGGFGDLWKDMPVRVSYEVVGDHRLAKSIEVVTSDGEPTRAVNGAVSTPPGASSVAPVSSIVPTPAAVAPAPAVVAPPATAPPASVAPPPAARAVEPAPVRTPSPAPAAPPRAPEPPPVKLPPAAAPPAPSPPPPARAALPATPQKPAVVEKPAPAPERTAPAPLAEPPRRVEPPPAARAVQPQVEPPPAARATQPQVETPSATRRSGPGEGDAGDGAAAIDWLLKERGGR
jgi:hypothetical protein